MIATNSRARRIIARAWAAAERPAVRVAMSRQRRRQLGYQAAGGCATCGQVRAPGNRTYCPRHLAGVRLAKQRYREAHRS